MLIGLVFNQALSFHIGPTESRQGYACWKANLNVTEYITDVVQLQALSKSTRKKISDLMASRENRTVCGHFIWTRAQSDRMHVIIHGQILESFRKQFGDAIRLKLDITYNNFQQEYQMQLNQQYQMHGFGLARVVSQVQPGTVFISFNKQISTSGMTISSPNLTGATWTQNVTQRINYDLECSETEAFTEKMDFEVPREAAQIWSSCRNQSFAFNITISLGLDIVNRASEAGSCGVVDVYKKLSNTCENILSRKVNTDLKIVASNGAILECHKCFLSVNSTVLAAMLESDMEESRSSRIELVDVSEKCVKALLEYLYTFKITQGRKCSILAVELFQVAHKYDIRQLEDELAKILQAQVNSWYDVNAALDLFRFARNVVEHNNLKLKCVEVLQLKADELLKSEKYQGLFKEDLATAMELCAIALKK